ncbi:hypothetical protein [Streptomyces sp. NPDC057257]|uniref:hypothetical protein n=1 Tax=Streptomyces sp. NPDC057257 TaxID=3346071 RepID=UPI00362669C3
MPPVTRLALQPYDVQEPQRGLLAVREAHCIQDEGGHPHGTLKSQPLHGRWCVRCPVQEAAQEVAVLVAGQLLGGAGPQQEQGGRGRALHEGLFGVGG